MMFRALAALLLTAPTIALTVAKADEERLRLTLTPIHRKKKGKDDDDDDDNELPESAGVLSRPLVIVGTPDELDVDLPAQLERYAQTRTSMSEVFADLDKQIEDAKKEAEEKLAAEKKRAAKGIPTITPPAVPAALPKGKPSIL